METVSNSEIYANREYITEENFQLNLLRVRGGLSFNFNFLSKRFYEYMTRNFFKNLLTFRLIFFLFKKNEKLLTIIIFNLT